MGIPSDDIREDLSEQCGLPMALAEIGEKWSLMILRAAFNGVRHFEEFLSEMGIARNILASRLVRLTDGGILERTPCPDDRRRVEYSLTQKGRDLLPAMVALRQWGEKWQLGVPSNPVLVDVRDMQPVQGMTIRSHDDRVLDIDDLCWIDASDRDIANPASRRDLEQHVVVADPAPREGCC
jgi:DNA-binding HxlR family transcriptional regulator